MTASWERPAYTGRASAAQYAAGRRWADRWARWPAHTDQQRQQDFDDAEQADEQQKWKHS
jgi:hypothetical protein